MPPVAALKLCNAVAAMMCRMLALSQILFDSDRPLLLGGMRSYPQNRKPWCQRDWRITTTRPVRFFSDAEQAGEARIYTSVEAFCRSSPEAPCSTSVRVAERAEPHTTPASRSAGASLGNAITAVGLKKVF
jgi:hypothetical protein